MNLDNNLDKTQPLNVPVRHIYRCACGMDVPLDPENGGTCRGCQRHIDGSVTQMPLSMTMTIQELGKAGRRTPPSSNEPCDDLVGKRLGHFEILELLGEGGMGQVYRALDTSLQRFVAVKVIRATRTQVLDEASRKRLMHEAIAQARVSHPNVVTIYFVGMEDDTPFLAMELINGYDVADLIADGGIPYEALCRMAIKITHALDTASAMGIVHADIKPQNLLVLPNGEVKLSDFGMAQLTDSGEDKAVGGTPNYLAPELLDGQPATPQSDMYALGVTLYEMTFGRLPVSLSGTTPHQWLMVHQSTPIRFPEPWPDHLPNRWKDILQRLLARKPEDRYASYQELGADLASILPRPRANAPRLSRAIAWLIDAALILMLFVLIFAAGMLLESQGFWFKPLATLMEMSGLLVSLVVFTTVVSSWRQTPGHELLHIKVVNQYGLQPSRKKMVLRSVMRQGSLWILSLIGPASFVFNIGGMEISMILAIIWLAITSALVIARGGRALHDRVLKTRAAVGSDKD